MPSMDKYLDNLLFGKPIGKDSAPLKETEINVEAILGEAESDATLDQLAAGTPATDAPAANAPAPTDPNAQQQAPAPDAQQPTPKQPIPDDTSKMPVDEYVKKARKIAKEHEPKGDLVLEIALQLEDKDCGKLEIGSEEYETITGWKIMLDKFGIDYKNVPDAIKSFRIDAVTKYSQTENDSVGISVELASDGETLGIQVFYNEEGNIMDNLEQALNEFNRRYREYIVTAINEKVRV